MTVHFIGAGPGAADLITLRASRIIAQSPACLYAGSLVPADLLTLCPDDAEVIDHARLSLDEIIEQIIAFDAAGPRCGTPAFGRPVHLFGGGRAGSTPRRRRCRIRHRARRTGLHRSRRRSRPGTDGARGLTVDRADSRVDVVDGDAPGEDLRSLGRSGGHDGGPPWVRTDRADRGGTVRELRSDCPQRSSRSRAARTEVVLRGTLATLVEQVHAAGITKDRSVIVGRVLAAEGFPDSTCTGDAGAHHALSASMRRVLVLGGTGRGADASRRASPTLRRSR